MVYMFILHRVVLRNAEYVNAQWYPLQFQFGTNAITIRALCYNY